MNETKAPSVLVRPAGSGGSAAPIDWARDVHVSVGRRAFRWRRDTRLAGRDSAESVASLNIPLIFAIGIGLSVLVVLSVFVGHLFGVEAWIPLLAVLVPAAAWSLARWWRVRASGRRSGPAAERPALDGVMDDRFRLRLQCKPRMLPLIGPLSDDPFEPAIFHVAFATRRPFAFFVFLYAGMAMGLIMALIVLKKSGVVPSVLPGLQFYEVWACLGLAAAPFYVLFPTYYRLGPGRLDVVRYGVMGVGRPRITTFDLRTCRVRADLRNGGVVIGEPGGRETRLDLGPKWSLARAEFAAALFNAARWRHDLCVTSEDSLVG